MTAPWLVAVGEVPGWPDGVGPIRDAVESARAAAGTLAGPRGVRDGSGRLAVVAAMQAARASAALAGAALTLEQALDPHSGAIGDPVLAGAVRTAAELATVAATWRRAPLQVLARLHTVAAADLVDRERLGRPTTPGAARLPALAELLVHSPWPAPVLTAVVHAELATLEPFGSADGVVARAAARLTMITTGLDPAGLGQPEVVFLRSGSRYRDGLRGYAEGGPEGVQAWVVQHCAALVDGAAQARTLAAAR